MYVYYSCGEMDCILLLLILIMHTHLLIPQIVSNLLLSLKIGRLYWLICYMATQQYYL